MFVNVFNCSPLRSQICFFFPFVVCFNIIRENEDYQESDPSWYRCTNWANKVQSDSGMLDETLSWKRFPLP